MNEQDVRHDLARIARLVSDAGYSPGTSGNISARVEKRILISPTGARLSSLEADSLSEVSLDGVHLAGAQPTEEAQLHAGVYRVRPMARMIIHLHSPFATALSCLEDLDTEDALPAYTPYYVMRVGTLPVVPYFPPG